MSILPPPQARTWMGRLAHDLRGPLSPMQTAIFLLRDGQVGEVERNELLAVMERQVRRLGGMIDEVGDLGRAEEGRLLGRREPIDLELLLGDIVTRLQAQAPVISFAPDARAATVDGDVLRLAQLLQSLLGLQFSRPQPSPVHAHVDWAAPGLWRMRCTVSCQDPSDALVEALLTTPHPDPPDDGLGLAIVIARAIAEAHGGRLHGHARAPDAIALVLELPARPPA